MGNEGSKSGGRRSKPNKSAASAESTVDGNGKMSGGAGEGDGGGSAEHAFYDEAADENAVAIKQPLTRMRTKDNHEVPVTTSDFDLMKVLGKGSFGKVFLVKKRGGIDDGTIYAMKTLRKEILLRRNQIEHTRSERAILQAVNHPFIVQLRYAFQTKEKLYMVTDFASGGELFFWLKRDRVFTQNRARLYAAELVLALEHLHSLDIVYRDLKPENILLDAEGHIKLTDFGLSKMEVTGFGSEGGTKTFCGTPEYLAPEILENKGHGKAVDWWSLGTLLYEMMAGLPPYYDTNVEVMYEKILTSELRFPRHFLPETRSLLAGMLTRKAEDRLGFRGAEEIKSHPFFAGLDWAAVYERKMPPQFVPPPNGIDGADAVPIVSNFEEEFTKEAPVDSLDEKSRLSSTAIEKTHFDGFTYTGDAGQHLAGGEAERDFSGLYISSRGGDRQGSFVEAGSPSVAAAGRLGKKQPSNKDVRR